MVMALAGPTIPAAAQDTIAEIRLRKMEAEIRALQRKVFSGPEGKFFEPEIKQGEDSGGTAAGQPATSAITDILARLDALEAQLARLTGQVEQNGNRIAQLEARAGVATPASATPAATPTPTPSPAATPTPTPTPTPAATPAAQANLNAMSGGASNANPPAAAPTTERLEGVKAIVKPQTDDPGDDEYSYGFRLWDEKYYSEAQQQLKLFVDKYPKHWRTSYGRNLLGRAYLDDGNAREAAKWFLQNYQSDKSGARAPDSLLYLAASMKQVKDTKRACIALSEFSETYAAEAAGRLKSLYDSTRNGLDCG
ncbi:MAG: hypothetical protein H6917_03640 [Novosphingobium sp.]|nr:hypothetical protein [Novosphingobium sp.]MCP5401465.1 hypothetical protein [Novosphingobium sp.]